MVLLIVRTSFTASKIHKDFVNFRLNHNFKKTNTLRVKHAYSYNETYVDIETEIIQTENDCFNLNMTLISENGPKVHKSFDNIWISESQNNKSDSIINIDDGNKIFTREYFFSDHNLYLFNSEGFCFEVVNKSNLVDVGEEESKSSSNLIKSSMPGVIVKMNVKVGDQVKKGDVILILEAMKMENMIKSQKDGKVSELLVKEAQFVEGGQTLLRFEEEENNEEAK